MHAFWLGLGVVIVGVGICLLPRARREFEEGDVCFFLIITTCLGFVGIPIALGNLYYLLKVKLAPAVYIIDNLMER